MAKLLVRSGIAILLSVTCLRPVTAASSLVDTVKAGDLAAVQQVLQQSGNPNAADADGTTALHWAAYMSRRDIVEALISAGANVNAKNRYGASPLVLAATNRNASIVESLLKAGADPQTMDPEMGTVLTAAARTGSPDIIRALLAKGAAVNYAQPLSGQTPLMWAAAEGHADAVKALLSGGADVHVQTPAHHTALFFAVRKGDIPSVEALLSAEANVNETTDPQDTPNCDQYCKMYPPGTKMSPNGDSMLVVSILNAHFELADFLLNHGADPNAAGTNWAPMHALERIRNYEEVQYPAPKGTGKLSSFDLAKSLLAHGADPSARAASLTGLRGDSDGGGDQNYEEFKGATPFLLAAKGADIEMMRFLLAKGADFKSPLEDHTTPLMVAAGIGCVPGQWLEPEHDVLATVKLLVEELKADVNAVNERGEVALHGAVCRGADSVIQYLVDHGAKLDVRDKEGQTPLEMATEGISRPIRIGGPNVILIKFQPHTRTLLKKLMDQDGTVASKSSP